MPISNRSPPHRVSPSLPPTPAGIGSLPPRPGSQVAQVGAQTYGAEPGWESWKPTSDQQPGPTAQNPWTPSYRPSAVRRLLSGPHGANYHVRRCLQSPASWQVRNWMASSSNRSRQPLRAVWTHRPGVQEEASSERGKRQSWNAPTAARVAEGRGDWSGPFHTGSGSASQLSRPRSSRSCSAPPDSALLWVLSNPTRSSPPRPRAPRAPPRAPPNLGSQLF